VRFFEVSEEELQMQRELFRTGRLQIKIEDIDFSMKCAQPSDPALMDSMHTSSVAHQRPVSTLLVGLLHMHCCL